MSTTKNSTNRKTSQTTKAQKRIQSNTRQLPTEQNREYWELVKEAFAVQPSEVNGQMTLRTQFYKDQLINIIKGRFKIKCPDWWDKDFILDQIIFKGYFLVADSKVGVAPFKGSVHGVNMFLRPPEATIVNEVLGTWNVKLFGTNANAVCIYLFDNRWFRSFIPIIDVYAEKLASCDCSIDVSLMNTRVPYIFNCADSKQAEEAKVIYDKVSKGEPAVFTKVKDPLDPNGGGLDVSTLPVKDNYVADLTTELKRSIIGEFLTVVGLNSNSYEKKERLITAEVDSNNDERDYNIKYLNRNLKRGYKAVNEMFGDKMEKKFKIKIEEGGKDDKTKQNGKDLYQKADQKYAGSSNNQR